MKSLLLSLLLLCTIHAWSQRVIEYVNPFIGTAAHGHTYPGATLPFGMVQLSPDNGKEGWDWSSGYNYSSDTIMGFSHTHLSGTGIGDLCDISIMPMVNRAATADTVKSSFSHQQEKASPGYYEVVLKDFTIKAELTTTLHCGLHQYTFPASNNAIIRFDLGFNINWDKPTRCYFEKLNDTTFVGYRYSSGWARDQKVYFAIRLNKPVQQLTLFFNKQPFDQVKVTARDVKACLRFTTRQDEKILMKVALSSADIKGALEGLKEINGWNFTQVKQAAEDIWEKELGKIRVTTHDAAARQVFYTALYHSYLAPNRFDDALGHYKNTKGVVADGTEIYTVHSLWDTFRANNPLFTLLQADRVPGIINSFLLFYQQYGLLPVWDLAFNETNCMTGYHAVPVITDAILKGIKGFDYNLAYEAMKTSSMQQIRGTGVYRQYGYVPQDTVGSSVTITLEYGYDDWCIAQVARQLGKMDEYAVYMKRSEAWKHLFDANTGFMRPKNSDGSWVEPFDPYYSEHEERKAAYTEGDAWQHSWFVPQDVHGLINAFGGAGQFTGKLDSLFTVSSVLHGEHISNDISGMIGQYAHGNEPSHHIAYLYNYAGMPWKTAEKVKQICSTLYTNRPDGICGNEDCGQMSAWYVWSALGFYPVNPASGIYVMGTPLMNMAVIQTPGGKTFTVTAKNLSDKNIYIQKATLDGRPYIKSYILHSDILKGGELVLYMGEKPSDAFGVAVEDRP
ncbi:putative alpha-1,2-mannosidase [Russula earlei]|uniref:Alpha-1,2-mannosidase n=1 Tax=Russula earlei TaxID=71964 RepID=A0ACC0TQT4_9AGAM|nr:putative alpha-1,2-mannosidase [Russula earlei]